MKASLLKRLEEIERQYKQDPLASIGEYQNKCYKTLQPKVQRARIANFRK